MSAEPSRTARTDQLPWFAAVGVLGFAVDAGVLHLAILGGLGLHVGRLLSYLCAVTVTWELNRRFTFRAAATPATFGSWLRFAVSQLGGAAVNLGCYFLLIHTSATVAHLPVIGVAAGSLLGMLLNFASARAYVFRHTARSGRLLAGHGRDVAAWGLLLLAFMWPAFYNGQAIFFFDTLGYVRGADTGIAALLHHHSHWSLPSREPGNASAPPPAQPAVQDKTVLLGRSWFYGALVYAGDLSGGFWLTVILQAAAVVAALALTLDALRLPRTHLLPIGLALALLSSLPFYTSFLMPDIFTGIVILGSAILLASAVALNRWRLAAWWLLLSAGVLFHDTNLLILCVLLLGAAVVRCFASTRVNPSGMAAVFLAITIGVFGQAAFVWGATRWYGVAPIRPPFLTARLIEDGTGVRYLKASCPGSGFQVCSYLDRLPMPADDFLWQTRPGADVFATASPESRRRLSAEQLKLARAVIAFDPAGQLQASLRNLAQQLVSSGLWEFLYPDEEKALFDQKFPKDLLPRLHASAAYRSTMPIAICEWILKLTFYGAACIIGAVLLCRRTRKALPPAVVGTSAWVLVGIVVNAFLCGALSGPHERYSMRVQWLLPLTAMLFVAGLLAHAAKRVSLRGGQTLDGGAP